MSYAVVQNCPLTFLDWSSRASSTCSNEEKYHCVEDEYSRIVEVCTLPIWIEAGRCPIYNTGAKKMDSQVCSGTLCPKEEYNSDAVYKYHGCQPLAFRTTTSNVNASTSLTTNISNTSIIVGSVTSVFVVILLTIMGLIFWRKKETIRVPSCLFCKEQPNSTEGMRVKSIGDEKAQLIESEQDLAALEKITPKELDADTTFISKCQDYLKSCDNTIAMFGKLGSGKRTLAAQLAIKIAKKDTKLKIKIVTERDALFEDLESRQSTILVIHNPVKTWFTSKHTDEILSFLLKICTNAKKNNSYVILIFHCDWESFKGLFGNNDELMEKICSKRIHICAKVAKLTEMAKNNGISNVTFQIAGASIGDPLIMTLYLKNRAFQNNNYLSNPTKFIFEKLKSLEGSPEIQEQLAFRIMVFIVLHDGEIAKTVLDDLSTHALFADLNMDIKGSINGCIKLLLDLFVEETANGQCYRAIHDVITKCTFLAAVENHMILLFTECDPMFIFDCIRLKSMSINENLLCAGKIFYDYSDLKIGIPSKEYPNLARMFFLRREIWSVLRNSRLYDKKKIQNAWNKAKLHFTN